MGTGCFMPKSLRLGLLGGPGYWLLGSVEKLHEPPVLFYFHHFLTELIVNINFLNVISPFRNLMKSTKSGGEGNDNPLQYSCLENPRDRGSWWAAISGVVQSRTRLKQLSSSSSMESGSEK